MVNVPSLLKVLETVIILNQAGLLNGKYKKSLWSNKTRVYEVYRRVMETDSLRLPPPCGSKPPSWSAVLRIRIRKILASLMRIYGSGSKGQYIKSKTAKKSFF